MRDVQGSAGVGVHEQTLEHELAERKRRAYMDESGQRPCTSLPAAIVVVAFGNGVRVRSMHAELSAHVGTGESACARAAAKHAQLKLQRSTEHREHGKD